MLASEIVKQHKLHNQVHTIVLFLGMLGLVALLGYLLAGKWGAVASVILAGFLMLLAPRISPKVVLKMYKAQQIDRHNAPNLHKVMQLLAQKAGLSVVPRLYYIPSTMMNAFAVGTQKNAHVAITDGLLKVLDLRDIAGVLAHEVSHISNNDMKVMSFADIISRFTGLLSNIGLLLLIVNLPLLLAGEPILSWWAVLLLILTSPLVSLLQLALSRTREFNADLYAALLTEDPMGLAIALKKIEYHKGNVLHQIIRPGYKIPEPSVFRSHPNTEERVERLQAMEVPENPPFELSEHDISRMFFEKHAHLLSSRPRWRPGGLWY